MFGYVRPLADELKVREYTTYKAIYCGLCRCMGRCVGCTARFTLSYDFVFLALLRIAVTGERISFDKGRCMAHPAKKSPYALPCDALDYSARASAILTHYKILDDLHDDRGIKRAARAAAFPFTKHAASKAGDLFGLDKLIPERLSALSALEAAREKSADAPAHIFGQMLSDVGGSGLDGTQERIAREICLHVGKWIYFADALDDLDDDAKKSSYNPLLIAYPDSHAAAKENMLAAMSYERGRAMLALELLDCDPGAHAILTNILTCGMAAAEKKIIGEKNGKSL